MDKYCDEHGTEFKYHYSYTIKDDDLRNEPELKGQNNRRTIPIKYYMDETRKNEIRDLDCEESISGFHRKLIFNLLSKVPEDESKLKLTAKYSYVVFEKRCFLFCIDTVVGGKPENPVIVPAQYLYEAMEERPAKDRNSTIEEYLDNLTKVWKKLNCGDPGLFDDPKKNWPFFSGFIEDTFEIEKIKAGVKFSGTGKLTRHPLGEFVGLVPIPRFCHPTSIPEHAIIVGPLAKGRNRNSSVSRQYTANIRSALEELTRILWADGGMATWIMGQPGTGKEVFSRALHYGSGRARELDPQQLNENEVNLHHDAKAMRLTSGLAVQSVAGVTQEEFNRRLFAVPNDALEHCVVEVIDKLNGTIFLDEFDKPKEHFDLYSSLLRVLEAKQFIKRTYSKDGQVQETPGKFDNVNWIFAGAFTQIDPRKNVPFDLWSRLKGFINLRNPLEDDPNYGATLFEYQYLRLVTGTLGMKGNLSPLMVALKKEAGTRGYREHIACVLLGQTEPLKAFESFVPSDDLNAFAFHFQRLLNCKTTFNGDRLDSPRGIFKATEAAFNFLREKVFHGEDTPLTTETIRDDALEEAHKSLRLSRGPS